MKYTEIDSPYIREKMKNTRWEDRRYIDDLIALRNYITDGYDSFAGNMGFNLLSGRYPKEYLELLKEHSPELYEKEIAEQEQEEKIAAIEGERDRKKEEIVRHDWELAKKSME